MMKLGLALIVAAVVYQIFCPSGRKNAEVVELAIMWKNSIREPKNGAKRIAVGVNSNLDLVVSGTALLQALGESPSHGVDHTSLSSPAHLQEQLSYSMQHCAGTERVFTDQKAFQFTVETADNLTHQYHIGGNAALMAMKIQEADPDAQVMLVAPVGDKLRKLLHPAIVTPTFTAASLDEVHMILEYTRGEQWGSTIASCANRVIYSHDLSNSKMIALEAFQQSVVEFHPDLVVLSGAHLLDGQPKEFWSQRLNDIEEMLKSLNVPVHWELATVGDLHFFKYLAESLFPWITSLGLNEQELVAVAKASNAGKFNFSRIPPKPSVEDVSDLLHWLMESYGARSREGSRLTRVHFHSLAFHVVATLKGSAWKNSVSSVQAGTREAGLQACSMEYIQPSKFELRIPRQFSLSHSDPLLSQRIFDFSASICPIQWERAQVYYVLSPVAVCRSPVKTVGLGDAISAMGLLYSEYGSV